MANGVHQRIRLAMHDLPIRFTGAPEYPRHSQRPILLGEMPNRATLPLDHHQHGQVAGRIGLHNLDLRLAVTKELGKGTGLGLSMIHGLARQLGGTLRMTSEVSLGTTAELWMPATDRALSKYEVPQDLEAWLKSGVRSLNGEDYPPNGRNP